MGHQILQSVTLLVAIAFAHVAPAADQPPARAFLPVGQMNTELIPESSGIARSPKYDGIFWTHNDSANPPELFAIKANGTLVARFPVEGAPNIDWEDVAVDREFIYVGDIGNNYGLLNVRIVYKFAEPDPYAEAAKPLKPLAEYRYKYPDEPFDAESLIVRDQRIYIIRKAGPKVSGVYRLTHTDGEYMTLVRISSPGGLRSLWITAADLSRDGRNLVTVNGYQAVVFPVDDDLALREDESPKFVFFPRGHQVEACCFDGDDVLLTSEQGEIYRITARDFQQQTRFVRPRPVKSR